MMAATMSLEAVCLPLLSHTGARILAGPAWGSKSGEKGLDSGDVLETELMELPRDRMGA